MKLLIVESPGKIKKLQDILGSEWRVAASCGHVRDLPNQGYGLEPPDFTLRYTEIKPDVLKKLAVLARGAEAVFLASDPDREGEAISWHLKDALGLRTYKRVTYTAITPQDVRAGLDNPRDIDMNLVHAQEARRALDRLCGYKVSGPLGRAVQEEKMSAGRVQSPAVRLVVERERGIRSFVSTTHYGVELLFEAVENISNGWKAAWLPKEGWLEEGQEYFLDQTAAGKIATLRTLDILSCEEKESRTPPPAPFTTSSLQQASSNALKFKPKKTMELAQKLYEAGHITYMRTDSPNLSESAITEIRAYCDAQGWPLSAMPRTWKSKSGAQEAHEAIRPTHVDVEEAGETDDEKALYRLIRIRTLASQLADAVFDVRVARLAGDVDGRKAVFEAKGRTLREQGWKVAMAADASLADAEEVEPDNAVPDLKAGCQATAIQGEVKTKKTKPASRFSEASLIREMEKRGIGRPATYAAILENITSRAYVKEEKGFLVPTPRGEKLVDALVGAFGFLDLDFTSHMEERLDDVAGGKVGYAECIGVFHTQLMEELDKFVQAHTVPCPACGDREQFRHIYSREKGWNFWGCKVCGATFADDNGRPGPKREKGTSDLTDFLCEKCGKPLQHLKGTKKNGSGQYDFFVCSGKECGAKYANVNGQPVVHELPALSEHKCKKCGKPLALFEGTSRAGKPYKKFNCSGYPRCRQSYWGKDDGTPDYENPVKTK
ncbi:MULTISPECIES: type I DNA topoisomerase [Desulfovibrio]|uniref:DNA topoisomerase 1 n=1 Tax=Desulfovibrio desulfuricans TaxID=876 RepID=A0AA94L391_DESDE|nr:MULTISPECIES: type I DNA topoisomerase [Desulfovibrio]ATD82356.1 DNA topoisomerase I [Desulfovibrio sp. G11]SFW69726.1 DNA topoisomerase-1 [Desulfovibrio desulfuricans]SPD35132.1 DNA topoisomerase [Desulfovibrio sp. G11]